MPFPIIFFLHAFLCKQRWRPYHDGVPAYDYNSSKKRPIFPPFFPSKKRWEQDYNTALKYLSELSEIILFKLS